MLDSKLNILLMDDNKDDSLLLTLEMKSKGLNFNYLIIDQLLQLKDALRTSVWDLILVDFSFPTFNAFDVINLIKQEGKEIPVIIITGTLGEELSAKLMKEGAKDFILKKNLSRMVPAIEREIIEFKLFQEHKNTQEMLNSIINTNVTAILVIDKEGKFIYANPQAKKVLNINKNEALPMNINFYQSLVSDFNGNKFVDLDNPFFSVINSEIAVSNVNVAININSNKKFFSVNGSPIKKIDGETGLFVFSLNDITEIVAGEEKLKKSNEEKDVLIKEIHHRVKNNLQIISSLLHLQLMKTKDSNIVTIIKDSQNRIKSLALIQQKLNIISNVTFIDFNNYIIRLINSLFSAFRINKNKINIITDIRADTYLTIDQAIPCGLILNELISNSLNYAFPEGNGEIKVSLVREGKSWILAAGDNGKGLPSGFDISKVDSLGLQLVRELVLQLEGKLEIVINNGVNFKITFQGYVEYSKLID